jgi:3-hydroxyisobutyrate dehydrogenase-like beta-hydroxyacid dehydrogenase
METVGILHPGDMGVSVAASAKNSGHRVVYVSEGRSKETRERAEKSGLEDAQTLQHLCEICSVIVSVCPPDAAEEVASSVLACGFTGLYLDANAISPQRAIKIGQMMADAHAGFVDGGIIGGPAWKPGATWLYLSGRDAGRAAACFASGPLETQIIGDEAGKASALKMVFAAYTKGSTALLSAVMAAAEGLNVRAELEQQWNRENPEAAKQNGHRVRQVTAKAWRFAGEMEEIAATLDSAGLPANFHLAAADVYRRMAEFKGASEIPALDEVLNALLNR